MHVFSSGILTGSALSPCVVLNHEQTAAEEEPMPLTKADREWLEDMLEQREAALMGRVQPQNKLQLSTLISGLALLVAVIGLGIGTLRNDRSDVAAFAAWQAQTNEVIRQMKEDIQAGKNTQQQELHNTLKGIQEFLEANPGVKSNRVRIPRRTGRLDLKDLYTNGTQPDKAGY